MRSPDSTSHPSQSLPLPAGSWALLCSQLLSWARGKASLGKRLQRMLLELCPDPALKRAQWAWRCDSLHCLAAGSPFPEQTMVPWGAAPSRAHRALGQQSSAGGHAARIGEAHQCSVSLRPCICAWGTPPHPRVLCMQHGVGAEHGAGTCLVGAGAGELAGDKS